MKPALKWTGGKTSELPMIKEAMPKAFNRFIEPFLGGGAVYFNLEPERSIVNDFNKELITFYSLLNNAPLYQEFLAVITKANQERVAVNNLVLNAATPDAVFQAASAICPFPEYPKFLKRELDSKLKILIRINAEHTKDNTALLTPAEIVIHYKTAINAALFYAYRARYNQKNQDKEYSPTHVAYWFLMRELAYSGMFRFSRQGNFNVPYGGISYNTKNLSTKLNHLETIRNSIFFQSTEFNNLDFEAFFNKYDYFTSNDFIFLDPPYDSEFSQYNLEEDFTKHDQERLRNVLLKTKAQIMLVIKDTEFIKNLYQPKFNISNFDKNYSVNFKNRNDRAVNHLIITNY